MEVLVEENNFNYEKKEKKIKIIQGDSKELNISSVKDNLNFEVDNSKEKKQNIIIPENHK